MAAIATPKMDIAWIGLGSMGFGMATNLVRRGHRVTAYDISTAALERFAAVGGMIATSPRELARGKLLYVCMVASGAQVLDLLFLCQSPLAEFLEPNATFLVTSTVSEEEITSVQQCLEESGRDDVLLVDCPVSGGARRAAEGTLTIMAAGTATALTKAQPLLLEMGDADKLFFPGELGQGSNMKMVHQVLADVNILATSEAMAFASWLGLDLEEVRREVLKPGSDAYSWMFENRSPRIIADWPTPVESAIGLVVKDLGIIVKTARKAGLPIPLSSTAEQIAVLASLQGFGLEDDATFARLYCPGSKQPQRSPMTAAAVRHPIKKEEAIQAVLNLLVAIHTLATAEAVDLAGQKGLDPTQVMNLVKVSAGASAAFTRHARGMFNKRYQEDMDMGSESEDDDHSSSEEPLDFLAEPLKRTVAMAQSIGCPLFLGNAALIAVAGVESRVTDYEEEMYIHDLVGL